MPDSPVRRRHQSRDPPVPTGPNPASATPTPVPPTPLPPSAAAGRCRRRRYRRRRLPPNPVPPDRLRRNRFPRIRRRRTRATVFCPAVPPDGSVPMLSLSGGSFSARRRPSKARSGPWRPQPATELARQHSSCRRESRSAPRVPLPLAANVVPTGDSRRKRSIPGGGSRAASDRSSV